MILSVIKVWLELVVLVSGDDEWLFAESEVAPLDFERKRDFNK